MRSFNQITGKSIELSEKDMEFALAIMTSPLEEKITHMRSLIFENLAMKKRLEAN